MNKNIESNNCSSKSSFSLIVDGKFPKPIWIPKWRYGGDRYDFDSPKLHMPVVTTTPHEHYHCLVLECDPLVISYCVYPLHISIRDMEGNEISSMPDAWVFIAPSFEQIREVKKQKEVEKAKKQIESQKSWCDRAFIEHKVIEVERDLPELLVSNCELIVPYLSNPYRPDIQKQVVDLIDKHFEISLRELRCNSNIKTQQLYDAALQLLCSGRLIADLHHQPFPDLILRRWTNAEPRQPLC